VLAALGVGLAPSSALTPPPQAPSAARGDDQLDAYVAKKVTADQLGSLAQQGYDLTEAHPTGETSQVDLVLTPNEAEELRGQGIDLTLTKVKGGQTVRQFAKAQAVGGYSV
jgi:hypothetical protein